jgi:hypothetical protein
VGIVFSLMWSLTAGRLLTNQMKIIRVVERMITNLGYLERMRGWKFLIRRKNSRHAASEPSPLAQTHVRHVFQAI